MAKRSREKWREYMATYRSKHADCHKYAQIKKKYGLTRAEYDALVIAQSGGCAICGGQSPGDRWLYVDHSHVTGRIRGLLCLNCNSGLGLFKDSAAVLRLAVQYLEKNNAN